MTSKETYTTVDRQATAEITEKKSRFICNIKHTESEDDAVEFIKQIKKKHYDARHNVYAYIIGDGSVKKCSDDGEPSKTAGVPIMQMLENEGITDVVCVVTRYFGGTLLGTGGLIRAYTSSAKEGLSAAGVKKLQLYNVYVITVPYGKLSTAEYIISGSGAVVDDKVFSADVALSVHIISEEADRFVSDITEKLGNDVKIELCEQAYR